MVSFRDVDAQRMGCAERGSRVSRSAWCAADHGCERGRASAAAARARPEALAPAAARSRRGAARRANRRRPRDRPANGASRRGRSASDRLRRPERLRLEVRADPRPFVLAVRPLAASAGHAGTLVGRGGACGRRRREGGRRRRRDGILHPRRRDDRWPSLRDRRGALGPNRAPRGASGRGCGLHRRGQGLRQPRRGVPGLRARVSPRGASLRRAPWLGRALARDFERRWRSSPDPDGDRSIDRRAPRRAHLDQPVFFR